MKSLTLSGGQCNSNGGTVCLFQNGGMYNSKSWHVWFEVVSSLTLNGGKFNLKWYYDCQNVGRNYVFKAFIYVKYAYQRIPTKTELRFHVLLIFEKSILGLRISRTIISTLQKSSKRWK